MGLQVNSLAAGVGSSVKNTQFQPTAEVLPRKIAVVGTYDPLETAVVDEVPIQILSAGDAGDRFGYGFMLHRLIKQAFEGSNGIQLWAVPQAETGGAVQASGDITFTGAGVLAGTVKMYIAGISVDFVVAAADTSDNIATKAVAAITADIDLPVTAAVNGVTTNQVDVTAKSTGPWGTAITLAFNIKAGDEYPTGVSAVITAMASGAGVPDIADALDGMGTDDDANEEFFTELVHGYGLDTGTIDDISAYVGAGNAFIGLYDKLVSRPFRALTGDTTSGSAGLTALQVITDARLTDRANGILAVPGSRNHPSEIAAQAIGHMARISNDRPEQSYVGIQLINIDPGVQSNRWTSAYDNRDIAVKNGISPTRIQNGGVFLQNVVSFYRPASVPLTSNGYRSMRNIAILQNILSNTRVTFEQEKWQGISIVQDVTKVSSTVNRTKARDVDAVKDDLVALAKSYEGKAWIFTASFTIDKLKEAGAVTIRAGNVGFDAILSIILSGEGLILDTVVEFDTSIAILT